MKRWKYLKGLAKHFCTECHGAFNEDEWDEEEATCLYCLFPEATRHRPAEFSTAKGYPVNTTMEEKMLETAEYYDRVTTDELEKTTSRRNGKQHTPQPRPVAKHGHTNKKRSVPKRTAKRSKSL